MNMKSFGILALPAGSGGFCGKGSDFRSGCHITTNAIFEYIYIYNISLIPLNNHHGISINSYSYPSYCEELIVFSIFRKTNIML